MTTTQRRILFIVIAVVLVVNVIATRNALTLPYPGHNDIMAPWEAARSYFLDGVPVYSEQSNLNIQTRIYGRAALPDEIPNNFAYPLFTIFPMWPLIHVSYDWATAIWMVALEFCLIAALALLLDLYRWTPRPLMLAALVLWTLFWYPASRGLLLGQISHLIYLLHVVTVWGLLRKHDTLAGLALVGTLFKPQMAYLLVPFVLIWALRQRRWRGLTVFFGGTLLLLGASFAIQPTWVSDWTSEIARYPSYAAVGSPVWVIAAYYLGLGSAGEWALAAVFYAMLVWLWVSTYRANTPQRWLWAYMVTLVVTHLIAPRTATTHFAVFAAPLVFYVALWSRQRRALWAWLLLTVTFVGPWLHFIATVDGEFEHPATYLPLPFGVALLLWLTRHDWLTFKGVDNA
jgi:hypothetical protein